MIIVDDILVSDEIREIYFACNLSACKGNCCVAGDAGAPLEEEEISVIEDDIEEVIPNMTQKGVEVIKKTGVFEYDEDGTYVTPLVNEEECAFVYWDKGVSYCAIEKTYNEGKISFQKPISCHLYPIRLSNLGKTIAVNYHQWDVCAPALVKGKEIGDPLYEYLRVPLIRKFGSEWYEKLVNRIKSEE